MQSHFEGFFVQYRTGETKKDNKPYGMLQFVSVEGEANTSFVYGENIQKLNECIMNNHFKLLQPITVWCEMGGTISRPSLIPINITARKEGN